MTTFNTGKPVGSSDPRDLYDNAENLDVLVNSPEKLDHADRLGVSRKTWHGMEQAFQEFLLRSGYQDIGDYAAGLEITARNQIFLREGDYYRAGPSLVLPYTMTGDWVTEGGNFVSAGDAALRQELAAQGGELVEGTTSTGKSSLSTALDQRVVHRASLIDVLALDTSLLTDGQHFVAREFIAGSGAGSLDVYWQSDRPKADHDGRAVISPTVPWDGTSATLGGFLGGVGETEPAGYGCYVRISKSSEIEVESYGTVSAETLNHAIADLRAGDIYTGGQLVVPVGNHQASAVVHIANESNEDILGVTLKGRGKQASSIDFQSQPAGQNGIEFMTPLFGGIEDMNIRGSQLSGVKLIGQPTIPGAPSWNHYHLERVRISFNGLDGFEADRGFMGHFEQAFITHNAENGFNFKGPLHTSLHFNNSYAAQNGQSGFLLRNATYSVLTACATDLNGLYGYLLNGCTTTVLDGCGSESNGRSGFASITDTASGPATGITLTGFLAYNNNTSNGGWPNALHVVANDGVKNVVAASGCRSHDPANATFDATVTGDGAYLIDDNNDFPNGVVSTSGGYVHHVPYTKLINGLSVTAATNVVELQNTQGGQTSFSGEILVTASNARNNNSVNRNIATYKLLVNKDPAGGEVIELGKVGQVTGGGASSPSFTWSLSGSYLRATPIGSTGATFYFEILTSGCVKLTN